MLILPRITLALIIVLFSQIARAGDKEDFFPGIFGEDNRHIVESLDNPWNAIGRVNVSGYRERKICTGTLITPRIVVTAAHCVIRNRSRMIAPLRNIHFLAGLRRDKYVAHASAQCVHLLKSDKLKQITNVERFESDVALIVLNKTLEIDPVTLAINLTISSPNNLVHASYARDRPYLLAADSSCRLREMSKGLWLTDCDTNFGGSGGPVLVQNSGTLRLAAIMVGVIKNKYSIAVPISSFADLLERSDCS